MAAVWSCPGALKLPRPPPGPPADPKPPSPKSEEKKSLKPASSPPRRPDENSYSFCQSGGGLNS